MEPNPPDKRHEYPVRGYFRKCRRQTEWAECNVTSADLLIYFTCQCSRSG